MATNAAVIQAQLAATTAPYEAQLRNLQLDYEASQKKQAEDNARRLQELYLSHEQNQRTLPQQLAAQGMNGGLTESSIVNLANTYQNNRNAQNRTYQNALADLSLDYNKNRNTVNAQIAAAQAQAQAQLAALAARRSGGGGDGGGGSEITLGGKLSGPSYAWNQTGKYGKGYQNSWNSTPANRGYNWSGYAESLKKQGANELKKQGANEAGWT